MLLPCHSFSLLIHIIVFSISHYQTRNRTKFWRLLSFPRRQNVCISCCVTSICCRPSKTDIPCPTNVNKLYTFFRKIKNGVNPLHIPFFPVYTNSTPFSSLPTAIQPRHKKHPPCPRIVFRYLLILHPCRLHTHSPTTLR